MTTCTSLLHDHIGVDRGLHTSQAYKGSRVCIFWDELVIRDQAMKYDSSVSFH